MQQFAPSARRAGPASATAGASFNFARRLAFSPRRLVPRKTKGPDAKPGLLFETFLPQLSALITPQALDLLFNHSCGT